jgi:hypothetical protein
MAGMSRSELVSMAYSPAINVRRFLGDLIEQERILAARPDRSKDDENTLREVRAAIAEIQRRGLARSG